MSCVIDFEAARRHRDSERRRLAEPPAAVVLITESGKIAAYASRPGAAAGEAAFGDEHETWWQPWSLACDLAERLRRHPSMRSMLALGFRIEAVRA